MLTDKFVIENETQVVIFDLCKIVYIVSDSNGADIFTNNATKIRTSKTMAYIKSKVPDYYFKINRNTIVNMNYIASISKTSCEVSLIDGTILNISVRNLRLLVKRLIAKT